MSNEINRVQALTAMANEYEHSIYGTGIKIYVDEATKDSEPSPLEAYRSAMAGLFNDEMQGLAEDYWMESVGILAASIADEANINSYGLEEMAHDIHSEAFHDGKRAYMEFDVGRTPADAWKLLEESEGLDSKGRKPNAPMEAFIAGAFSAHLVHYMLINYILKE